MGIGKVPWGAPLDGELAPRLHPGVDLAEDAAIIRWCLRRWLGRDDAPQGSPLGRIVQDLEHALVQEPSDAPVDEVPTADTTAVARAHFDFANIVVGHRLAWSLRAIVPRLERKEQLHASVWSQQLVRDDLQATDAREGPRYPGALETLFLAAVLLQAGGGYLEIRGKKNKSAGADIVWRPDAGGAAWIECKQRPVLAAYFDGRESLSRWAERWLATAAPQLRPTEPAARVVAFGCGLMPYATCIEFHESLKEITESWRWDGLDPATIPDAICWTSVALDVQSVPFRLCSPAHFVERRGGGLTLPDHSRLRSAFLRAFPDPRRVGEDRTVCGGSNTSP